MIKEKILSLSENSSELSTYLFSLFDQKYKIEEDEFLIDELEKYLFKGDDWLLKKAALAGLLLEAKIKNISYIERALTLLLDQDEDEEVRSWAIISLLAVCNIDDLDLVKSLKAVGFNQDEDAFLRHEAIQGLLRLNGLPYHELNLRDGYIPSYEEDFTIEGFIEFVKEDLKKFDLLPPLGEE